MLIETHHDRHPPTPLPSPPSKSSTTRALTRAASSATHRIPWDTVGPPIPMAGSAASIRARLDLCRSTRRTGHLHRDLNADLDMTSFVRSTRSRSQSPWVLFGLVGMAAAASACPAVPQPPCGPPAFTGVIFAQIARCAAPKPPVCRSAPGRKRTRGHRALAERPGGAASPERPGRGVWPERRAPRDFKAW